VLLAAVLAGCGGAPQPEAKLVRQGGRWVRVRPAPEGTPEGELARIRRQVERGQNRRAVRRVKKFLKKFPGDERTEEVLMLAGRAEIRRGRYMKAYRWYEKQLSEHPGGKYFDRAIEREFQIAEAFLAGRRQVIWGFLYLSAKAEALEMLSRLAEHVPGSIRAEDALLQIADYHFQSEQYLEAVAAFDNYLEFFGKSDRAGYALFRSAQAVYATFLGIPYDDTALLEAELRFRAFAERYPGAVGPTGTDVTLREIAALRAQKDCDTAAFYERVSRPDAARFYYQEASGRYGSNPWAEKAQAALKRLGPSRARPVAAALDETRQ
jgi:outer membrane protein assembly factor BamD (BamD/ComL family)